MGLFYSMLLIKIVYDVVKIKQGRRRINGLSHYSRSKNQPNNQFPGITCGIIASVFYHIKIIMKIFFFLFGLLLYSLELSAAPPRSFPQAKTIVYKLFAKHPQRLYCNCRFDSKHQVDLDSCHMSSASDKKTCSYRRDRTSSHGRCTGPQSCLLDKPNL